MTEPEPTIVEVDEATLRTEFSIGEFEDRAKRGELTVSVKPGSEHAAPAGLREPGATSRILQYFLPDGTLVALAHEYVRPDGTRAASGRSDPKWLRIGDRILKQRRRYGPEGSDQ